SDTCAGSTGNWRTLAGGRPRAAPMTRAPSRTTMLPRTTPGSGPIRPPGVGLRGRGSTTTPRVPASAYNRRRRARTASGGGMLAVGVLGSDVYDKLPVLQALRPLLPTAWFFTTDLDALLLHPTAQKLTRNLLVAASFGLQLRPEVQGEIPPFRSSYQTAAFLATRVAIHSNEAPRWAWLRPPLLFEIGNSRTFQYSGRASGTGQPIEFEARRAANSKCNV